MTLRHTLALLTVAGLMLTGCGTTEPAASSGDTPSASAQDAGPVTVTDGRGKEVTLDAPATKVVGLEWNVVEHAVSLGVMPVGVADVAGYNAWVSVEPLDDSVTDVGVRGEPSVEAIGALAPDVILTTTDYPESVARKFEERGIPVVAVQPADAGNNLDQMRENLELVATVTGTEDKAVTVLSDFDAKVEEGSQAIADAGLTGAPFFMTDGYLDGGQLSIRPYAEGSLLSETLEAVGIDNAWTKPGDKVYGLGQTDVEGLTALPDDVSFFYMTNDVEDDPFTKGLRGNAIWDSFPFVKAGDVTRLPDGLWMFGGPTSMSAFIDAVVAELT